jgi:Hsp20/alpha crystallin family
MMTAGFRKEHIKVMINNTGKLIVTGERPVADNKWIRFRKEFQTPKDCNQDSIRAKLENGSVYITLPKVVLDQPTKTTTQDRTATEPKLPGADQNGHSKKTNGEKKEEKRSEPPPVDAQNKIEDKEADHSDTDSKSSSDSDSDSEDESTKKPEEPADQQKLSMRLLRIKEKALESAYGSRKAICGAFAVIVISVGVGLIISNKLIELSTASEGSNSLVPMIIP